MEMDKSFWGLTVEPGKEYTQSVGYPIHISTAALDASSPDRATLNVVVDGEQYVLCSLHPKTCLQHNIGARMAAGQAISFSIAGTSRSTIHLTGFFDHRASFLQSMHNMQSGLLDSDEGSSESESDDGGDSKADAAIAAVLGKRQNPFATTQDAKKSKQALPAPAPHVKQQDTAKGSPAKKAASAPAAPAPDTKQPALTKKQKRLAQKAAQETQQGSQQAAQGSQKPAQAAAKEVLAKTSAPVKKAEPAKKTEPSKKTEPAKKAEPAKKGPHKLAGGTVIEDIVIGTGPVAKAGRMVSVHYIGRLAQNNKVFDANTRGKRPFRFKLGLNEVIKGWDAGVAGMQVGGKRILRIPPAQGYGKRGAPPDIPGNAALNFEVELVEIK